MDELGRGTSKEEGFGISHAVCEYLLCTEVNNVFVLRFFISDLNILGSIFVLLSTLCCFATYR